MKAILLALAAGALLLVVATWRLRQAADGKGAAKLLTVFLIILPVLAVTHLITPRDLGVLPTTLQIPIPAIDFAFCLFLYTAGFFGGVLQLYNLAERGFSLRILIDILHAPSATMTLDDVMEGYGAGRGIAWMYGKRVDGMRTAGLVVVAGDRMVLTERGHRIARLFSLLQDFARVERQR
jgi:hypothetical protein